MNKPECPQCGDNSGVFIKGGIWYCGDCNYDFEEDCD